jgi:hypothetical protein
MTQRAPLHVRIPLREWPRELLTWVDGGPQLGSQPIPDIQSQSDWPNPVLARPSHELRTWVNGLPPGVVANPVPPIRNYDWQNPTLRVQNHEQRTWLHSQQLTPATVMPFSQYNWPNPQTRARNQDLLSWVEGLPQPALSLTIPPRQSEWPNPVYARANIDLRSWTQQPQITVTVVTTLPYNQRDWPNPVIARANHDLRTWTNGLPSGQISLTIPPGQRDWPLPPPARPNTQLRSFSFSLQIQPQVQLPFNQSEWPNPPQKRPNLELRVWRQGVPQGVLSNPLPPIRQTQWPNPFPRASNLELRTWVENFSIQAPAGLSDTDVIVPYLIGDTLAAALMRIASIFGVASVTGTTGTVTAQDPAAFTRVPRGTTISITLGGTIYGSGNSRARAPYGVPDMAPPFPDPKIKRH